MVRAGCLLVLCVHSAFLDGWMRALADSCISVSDDYDDVVI